MAQTGTMRVTVLGLGGMGAALAARLLDGGHEVTVWNRSPGRAGTLTAAGATQAASAPEAVRDAEVVLASLLDDPAVHAVLLPGGRPLTTDAYVINCATGSPGSATELAAAYPGCFVAAPVLGAPRAVSGGTATYLLGGPAEAREALAPIWSALTTTTLVTGADPASAAVAKLAVNSLLLTGLAALSEAVAATQAAGLSTDVVGELFGTSVMVAPGLVNRLADVIDGTHDDGWFAMPLGAKDLNLFRSLAQHGGLTSPVADAAAGAYEQASETDLRTLDIAGIVEFVRGHAAGF